MIFLFYINSFLIKRRKSEFGLYNILGMEKKHICRVIFLETVFTFLITMAFGLFLGIMLDKLLYLVISHILAAKIPLGFHQLHPAKPDAVRRYFPADVPELHEAHLPLQTGRSS